MSTSILSNTFLALIERSGLLPPETLLPYLERVQAHDGSLGTREQIAQQLVCDRLLTPYQSQQLLDGHYRGFFLTEKFKILDVLGEGGMGRVYLCEHLLLERLVAVKVLQLGGEPIPGAEERFLREARAAATLDHPNIARIFDIDRTTEAPFLVMEHLDGTNFHQLIAQHGPLSIPRAAHYIRQAALGLQHAHEKGLIHRDIKPGNLVLDRSGTVKMLDLGLARFFDTRRNKNLTRRFDSQNILGTADFIAPEQAMNSSDVDIRADIYSLGCTFYFVLLGRFPYDDGSPNDKLRWHQSIDFDPVGRVRPEVPTGLVDVLNKMVRKTPDERYSTPAEVAEALSPWATPSLPHPPAWEMPAVRPNTFQLGLCPAPSVSALSNDNSPMESDGTPPIWTTPRPSPTPRAITSQSVDTPRIAQGSHTPRSAPVVSAVPVITPHPSHPVEPVTAKPVLQLRLLAIVGLIATLSLATGIIGTRLIYRTPAPESPPAAVTK